MTTNQTFTGETIEDVLVQVRGTLGEDAVILSTQEATTGGMSGFFGKRTIVVTARAATAMPAEQRLDAIDGTQVAMPAPPEDASDPVAFSQVLARQLDQVRVLEASSHPGSGSPAAAPLAAYQSAAPPAPGPDNAMTPSDDAQALLRQEEMARLAEEVLAQRSRLSQTPQPEEITLSPLPPPPTADPAVSDPFGLMSPPDVAPASPNSPPAAAIAATPAEHEMALRAAGVDVDMPGSGADEPVDPDEAAPAPSPIATRLGGALSRVQAEMAIDVAPAVEALWSELRRVGVSESNVLSMRRSFAVRGAAFSLDQGPRKALREWIADGAPVVRGLSLGLSRTVALVGQTGVGKSTSACKLAGRHQSAGQTIGLIAAGRGPHAVLEHYAREMGLAVMFADSPEELAAAHAELSDRDLVIVDTAGRSYRHAEALTDLEQMLAAIPVDEVHLVTTLASGPEDVTVLARAFAPAGADRLILTKLDESERTGNLINSPLASGLPLGYLADGVSVPDAIFPATGLSVAELLLPTRRRA